MGSVHYIGNFIFLSFRLERKKNRPNHLAVPNKFQRYKFLMNEIQNKDDFFMRQALAEARRAFDLGEVPIGAVVVWGDRIVGRGHNLVETLNDPTAHAEMQAITAATASVGGKYLSECRLYVTVEPCVMCAGACYWSQVGSVIYGAADPKRGVSTVSQAVFHPKTTVRGGILEAECGELVSSFFRKLRK